ncbi:MAG: hypothetical protein ACYCPT_11475 [Acidimicrobiales bacterium]
MNVIVNKPKVSNDIQKFLPTVLYNETCSLDLVDVNMCVANALRRVIEGEIPVKYMYVINISTDDPFIINELIMSRISLIPVNQSINSDTKISLHVKNTSETLMSVKSGLLTNATKFINETFEICTLNPRCSLDLEIILKQNIGSEFGGAIIAFNVVSIPVDQTPYDYKTKTGVRSGVCDPRHFIIKFGTNGTMPCSDIIKQACNIIIDRLENFIKQISSLVEIAPHQFSLHIAGENHTIATIIMKTASDNYPDLTITYDNADTSITLRMITDSDPAAILNATASDLITIYKNIEKINIKHNTKSKK